METMLATRCLAALAHDGRLGLVRRLVQSGPEGMRAGDLARAEGLQLTTASAQLGVLAHAGACHRNPPWPRNPLPCRLCPAGGAGHLPDAGLLPSRRRPLHMLLTPPLDPVIEARLLRLNRSCPCLDHRRGPAPTSPRPERFFAAAAVMLTAAARDEMFAQIAAIEAAAATPAYQQATCAGLPARPAQDRTRGLLMGYDFHITPDGPRLIEINTNAGGAFLAAAGVAGAERCRCIEAALLDHVPRRMAGRRTKRPAAAASPSSTRGPRASSSTPTCASPATF